MHAYCNIILDLISSSYADVVPGNEQCIHWFSNNLFLFFYVVIVNIKFLLYYNTHERWSHGRFFLFSSSSFFFFFVCERRRWEIRGKRIHVRFHHMNRHWHWICCLYTAERVESNLGENWENHERIFSQSGIITYTRITELGEISYICTRTDEKLEHQVNQLEVVRSTTNNAKITTRRSASDFFYKKFFWCTHLHIYIINFFGVGGGDRDLSFVNDLKVLKKFVQKL